MTKTSQPMIHATHRAPGGNWEMTALTIYPETRGPRPLVSIRDIRSNNIFRLNPDDVHDIATELLNALEEGERRIEINKDDEHPEKDWRNEAKYWQARSRQWEDRAKALKAAHKGQPQEHPEQEDE